MKVFKNVAIDSLDAQGEEEDGQQEYEARIGLLNRDREGAIDKEDGGLDLIGREAEDNGYGDASPPDDF